jgi:hypothetical protein
LKSKPIIISTDLIPSTMSGDKTMTRRLRGLKEINKNPDNWIFIRKISSANLYEFMDKSIPIEFDNTILIKCPYAVGDELWVREMWADYPNKKNEPHIKYCYRTGMENNKTIKWKSPRYMPKIASRITLEVTAVDVERLQEISATDCIKEGLKFQQMDKAPEPKLVASLIDDDRCFMEYKPIFVSAYEELWDDLNKKRGYGWKTNPFVWVVEFNIKPI